MRHLLLSTSLDPGSRSRLLVRAIGESLAAIGETVRHLDFAELDLPYAGAPGWLESAAVRQLDAAIADADGVVMGLGIYNYGPSAAAKAAVELGGRAWKGKVVSLACAAGARASYMSAMPLVHALMLDFRCVVLPRFVFATANSFDGDDIVDRDVLRRLGDGAREHARVTRALAQAAAASG